MQSVLGEGRRLVPLGLRHRLRMRSLHSMSSPTSFTTALALEVPVELRLRSSLSVATGTSCPSEGRRQ